MKRALFGALGAGCLLAGIIASPLSSPAADHLEAPLVQEDGRVDINDLYAFQSPENPDNTVLIMTVNPAAGVLSPETFATDAHYRFRIDNDDDARPESTIRVDFGRVRDDGSQNLRIGGLGGGVVKGKTGEHIALNNGGRAFAGTFDDPFFFDFQAFQDQVKGAGGSRVFCDDGATDFFAGLNVSAIVLEVPSETLLGSNGTSLGVWAETRAGGQRIDRMGRPAIATVLVPDGMEDDFNRTRPHRDRAEFLPEVRDSLLALSGLDGTGYTKAEARAVAKVLLPDILTIDSASTDGYLNGRGLSDDVIDLSLTVVTGGLGANGSPVLTSDCVDGNDVAFSTSFPYLAPRH